jgi:hypothetical protein
MIEAVPFYDIPTLDIIGEIATTMVGLAMRAFG